MRRAYWIFIKSVAEDGAKFLNYEKLHSHFEYSSAFQMRKLVFYLFVCFVFLFINTKNEQLWCFWWSCLPTKTTFLQQKTDRRHFWTMFLYQGACITREFLQYEQSRSWKRKFFTATKRMYYTSSAEPEAVNLTWFINAKITQRLCKWTTILLQQFNTKRKKFSDFKIQIKLMRKILNGVNRNFWGESCKAAFTEVRKNYR